VPRLSRSAAVLLLASVGPCLDAAPAAAQVAGGVKGGVAFSSFLFSGTDPEAEALTSRPDFIIGGFVTGPAASPVSAQVEVMYSRRGARLEAGDTRIDFKLSYFDVSGLVRGNLTRNSAATVYLFGGVTTGITVDAKQVLLDAGNIVRTDDLNALIDDFDVRILVGGGVEVRRMLFEGRYTHGFRRIIVSPDASPVAQTFKNRAFELLVGVRF
jgi:hypothetical protein